MRTDSLVRQLIRARSPKAAATQFRNALVGLGQTLHRGRNRGKDSIGLRWDVTLLGADPLGIRDSTQAILDAIALAAVRGGIVYFPAGDYLVSSTIIVPSWVTLRGVGVRIGTTSLRASRLIRDFSGTLIDASGTNGNHVVAAGVEHLVIDGLDVAGGLTGTAIDSRYTSGFRASYVEVYRNIGRAFHCAQTWDAMFERPWVRRCGDAGVTPAFDIDNTDTDTTDTLTIFYPHFESNYASHLKVQASGSFAFPPRWVALIQPKLHGFLNGSGEEINEPLFDIEEAEDFQITGGQLKGNGDDNAVLRIGATRGHVQCMVQGDGSPAVVEILGTCNRVGFDLNMLGATAPAKVIINSGANGNRVRVIHGAASSMLIDNSGNLDNTIIEEQDGIVRYHAGRLILRTELGFSNGDTTPSVKGGNFFGVNNAAAATITGLDDGIEGQIVYLTTFNSNTTFQHSATFWLQGERDWSPDANDILIMQRRDNRWHELGRSYADAGEFYNTTNVTTDRSFDADTVTVAELADVVGTLIADIRAHAPWILT